MSSIEGSKSKLVKTQENVSKGLPPLIPPTSDKINEMKPLDVIQSNKVVPIQARKRKAKPFSLIKIFERIFRVFQNLLKSSDDDTYSTSPDPYSSEVTPVKLFQPLDAWPEKKSVFQDKNPGWPFSFNFVRETIADPIKYRNDIRQEQQTLSKTIGELVKDGKDTFTIQPRPQTNVTGNVCYMNSSLQSLEACYVQFDKNLQNLLLQDLTLKPHESLKDFEERILHTWAPIEDPQQINIDALTQKADELKLAKKETQDPIEKRKLVENEAILRLKIHTARIEQAHPERYDERILFKLSYLLVLQAKKYGSKDQIDQALKLHHKTLFMLDLPYLEYHERNRQLDASNYMRAWHDTLNIVQGQSSFKEAEGYISPRAVFDPAPILEISIRNEREVNNKSLAECLEKHFHTEILNSADIQKLNEEKKRLEGELTNAKLKSQETKLKKEIIEVEKRILRIAGGEFTRPNGTKATASPNGIRSKSGQFYPDYIEKKMLLGSPPPFIQLALKRFVKTLAGVESKISDQIPLEFKDGKPSELDLSSYFYPESVDNTGARYEIIGVVEHLGHSLEGGHYVSYVKRGDQWFYTSDSTVSKIDVNAVPFDKASVLSYRKID